MSMVIPIVTTNDQQQVANQNNGSSKGHQSSKAQGLSRTRPPGVLLSQHARAIITCAPSEALTFSPNNPSRVQVWDRSCGNIVCEACTSLRIHEYIPLRYERLYQCIN